jgi:hypothetical protein
MVELANNFLDERRLDNELSYRILFHGNNGINILFNALCLLLCCFPLSHIFEADDDKNSLTLVPYCNIK